MSLKAYIISLFLFTALGWTGFGFVLSSINPNEAGFLGFLFFYASLFLACAGTFALAGYYVRIFTMRHHLIYKHINVALRQGVWLSLLAVVALFMQSQGILYWWNLVALIGMLMLIEFGSIAYGNRKIKY